MFHVVDLQTGRIIRSFTYRGWANRNVDAMLAGTNTRFKRGDLVVMHTDEYRIRRDEFDPYVEVKNLMSGKPVMIRKSEAGTCVDPSTETYWSM
jgi:hypothetical protein